MDINQLTYLNKSINQCDVYLNYTENHHKMVW